MERPHFESLSDYSARFTDAGYWRPLVETVCFQQGLTPCRNVRAGLPGTHPVFIVDNRYVVKLFSDLFEGGRSFAVETELYPLLAAVPQIPAPRLLARGYLFADEEGWRWPYLISTLIPGVSFEEARDRIGADDQLALAAQLGSIVRRIHALPVARAPVQARSWNDFMALLQRRREHCAGDYLRARTMPARLINQIDEYLPPIEALVDRSQQPRLLHCDLNGDHILGMLARGHWQTTGIIDFGDARLGDPLYELGALHLGLFRGNKRCLRAFIEGYGSPELLRERFVTRAMSLALLHEFTVLDQVFTAIPQARQIDSLSELATLLWDLEEPGFSISEG